VPETGRFVLTVQGPPGRTIALDRDFVLFLGHGVIKDEVDRQPVIVVVDEEGQAHVIALNAGGPYLDVDHVLSDDQGYLSRDPDSDGLVKEHQNSRLADVDRDTFQDYVVRVKKIQGRRCCIERSDLRIFSRGAP
jgi:hypothetical protein